LKPISFIPPVVALIIAGGWLASQHQSITRLEQKSSILRKSIAARLSGAEDDSPGAKKALSAKAAKDKEPLDWKKIAAEFAEMRENDDIDNMDNMDNMRIVMRFKHRLQTMTKEELVAALDEIAALDLTAGSRAMLEQMLVEPLIQKDPELALTHFIDHIQNENSGLNYYLSCALQELAKKDPVKASAWFDQQIAAGKFDSKSLDGKSEPRQQFEGALIEVLLASDPDAAGHRLGAIPEDQRYKVLTIYPGRFLKEENQLTFAKLIRSQLPADEQADTLAQQASYLIFDGGYSKVTDYLNRIEATPSERAKCAEEVANSKMINRNDKKVTRENLDEMREWVTTQAPEALASITGKSLGRAAVDSHKMEFSEAADLALQYNQISSNDDVLINFLESWPARENGNKEEARALAEKITDEKRREEILKDLE
jgi:hypothetical protein